MVDLTKDEYESMDVCFLVVINRDRVNYIETIKGKTDIDAIHKCVKFAISCFGNNTN